MWHRACDGKCYRHDTLGEIIQRLKWWSHVELNVTWGPSPPTQAFLTEGPKKGIAEEFAVKKWKCWIIYIIKMSLIPIPTIGRLERISEGSIDENESKIWKDKCWKPKKMKMKENWCYDMSCHTAMKALHCCENCKESKSTFFPIVPSKIHPERWIYFLFGSGESYL